VPASQPSRDLQRYSESRIFTANLHIIYLAASVGNLGVTEENEKIGRIFDSLFFIGYWLFGFAGVCLLELLNPFVKLAFGKKYLFPKINCLICNVISVMRSMHFWKI
jgi:uncharacterized membrane protein